MVSFKSHKAQTAAELAVFGAILMFVVGLIVRTAMSASQQTNQQLKAMRMAMTQSYLSSMGAGVTRRNSASVTIVEDRLSVDTNSKLATRDRIPFIVSASAVFSNQLFQPVDYGEVNNLAVQDIFINGQQFPLLTAGFREIPLSPNHPGWTGPPPNWEPNCYAIPAGASGGCVIAYKVINNGLDGWCIVDPCARNMNLDDRFNLDHKTNPTMTDVPANPPAIREKFGWQWIMAPSLQKDSLAWQNHTLKNGDGTPMTNPLDNIKAGDTYDIDGDGKEEIIYDFKCRGLKDGDIDAVTGVINCARIADSQEGDIDYTEDDRTKDPNRPMGLQDDVQMFSFTQGITGGPSGNRTGTYLLVEEGKLFDPASGQFIRNTNRQNHIDIIQRIFRLSRDTDRFCDANHVPTASVSGVPNPVEACNNCFSPTNVSKTCMDEAQKLIFIRSRIADLRGRRWVTKSE